MSLLQDLNAGKLHDFHGGIHPPERKAPANLAPISHAGLPEELVLQVRQHIGQPAKIRVNVGERVLRGQPLTEPLNPMMIPVHAPTSGIIAAIEDRPLCHPSGLDGLCIVLKPDGEDQWRPRYPVADFRLLGADVLLERIHQSGVTGLGGAGFPAHVKLTPRKKKIETLIINGVECEPYISADDRLMREHPAEILLGVEILRHIVQPQITILAVEDNKPEALAALRAANRDDNLLIVAVPTKYPSGGEKQLIEVLTGLQVPRNGLPADIGIVVQNVGTAYAVKQAVIDDEPLTRRVVTLAGEAFAEPGNAWVHIGTPVRYLLHRFGLNAEPEQRIIMGGPMMGFTLHSAAAPIIKGSNCILAPKQAELAPPAEEMACIRCSNCADACPVSLLPQQLYWYARSQDHDKLNSHHLFDCIECGACAYVCPSTIPLVQYYRVAKAEIRQAQREAELAERAKQRFEARLQRLAREKEERQARQAKAASERKARMAEQAASGGEDPVAAALARVKARQQEQTPDDMAAARAARKEEARRNRELKQAQADGASGENNADGAASSTDTDKKSAVAAAVARAKARKATQADAEAGKADAATPAEPAHEDPKKAAVAAAVARAKARKAAQADAESGKADATAPAEQTHEDPKKAAVAAAVARAKARKAAQADTEAGKADAAAPAEPAHEDPKKAAVAAAVARAKARKAAQADAEAGKADAAAPAEQAHEDPKKAAVAAAVARAKARKAAQAEADSANTKVEPAAVEAPVSPAATAEDPAAAKQAAIKAAVARAKARKAAQAEADSASTEVEPAAVEAPVSPAATAEDPAAAKQAAIKAAVARAKARKAAQAEKSAASTPSDREDES